MRLTPESCDCIKSAHAVVGSDISQCQSAPNKDVSDKIGMPSGSLGNATVNAGAVCRSNLMEFETLIADLSRTEAYPVPVSHVEVLQTHISVVFLAGEYVYKVKKPVRLSFLDFSSLELRREFCDAEVRLNRRLAPDVYLGVVPITESSQGLQFEGEGRAVDCAVKMRRLPGDAMLEHLIDRDRISIDQLRSLGSRLAAFHRTAASGEEIARFGRFEAVAKNVRENFEVAGPSGGGTVSQAIWERLIRLTESELAARRELVESRAARGIPRDTHGDLHLDHVYLFPDRLPPGDLVIVDCIEFNDRFRYTDPVADLAFLVMDLQFHGRWDLAGVLAESWFASSGDEEGRALLPLYVSYRAAVRGKVDCLLLRDQQVDQEAHDAALVRARGHWSLALGSLESPSARPAVVLVGGLPGTGKSTVARELATRAGFEVLRSDVIRKELAGLAAENPAASEIGEGLYSPEWTERTYGACLSRAEAIVREGGRVIVDATFSRQSVRRQFEELARRWSVPIQFLVCEAAPDIVHARLQARRGDASDADWKVYLNLSERWESPPPSTQRIVRLIDTSGTIASAVERAVSILHADGLC
jgi:aminoglycoside phosphotransferase family enzyme/predicted kinase